MLELCIKKPVISAVIALVILLLGLISFFTLPLRSFPVIPANQVTITTSYYGASPDVMQGFITQPMQEQLSGLDGVDYIQSTNTPGTSVINIYFNLGADVQSLLSQISDRVQSVSWKFPKGSNTPQIQLINPNTGIGGVVIWIGFTSDTIPVEGITAYLNQVIKPRIESLPGVYDVALYGDLEYQMSILLNPHKMAAYGVTAIDVQKALQTENVDSTAGIIKGNYINFNVNINSNLSDPEHYNQIIVKKINDQYVRIKDIGDSALKNFDPAVIGTLNGKRSVVIAVSPKVEANAIEISKETRDSLSKLKTNLPPGLSYKVLLDRSTFSKLQIEEVKMTILVSVIFVFIVIFLFLGSFRSLLVPIVTIPLSILGGAFVMLCLGYSLNSLTMLSWVLAIGLVVDDAIVVIENIHRYIEKGMSSLEASLVGVKEIAPSIVAMTLVVAVNFIPIGFMPGFSGALFKEFAFTMAIVVIFSGVLALFVSPAMCCGLLRPQKPKDLSVKIDHIMQKFCKKYQAVLEIVLAWKYFILILFVIGILGGFFISKQIKSEMTPVEPDGVVVAFGLGPEGRNLDYTVKYGNTLNKVFSNIKAGTVYGVFYGFGIPSPLANQVNGFISLNSLQIEDAVMAEIQEAFSKVAGMLSLAFPMPTLPGNQAMQPINFVLKTNGSYEHLYMALQTLIKETANYPSIAPGGQGDLKYSTPQVSVELNRDKAQSLGVSADDVNNTLNLMLG